MLSAMTVRELGHVVLFVADLDRSRRFYGTLLEFPEVVHIPGRIAAYSGGRTHHELMLISVGDAQPIPRGRRLGMYHFALKIGDSDDELRAVLARLQEADVRITGASDHGVSHSLYIVDPDGNEVELYIDVPGVDWRSDPELLAGAPRPLIL
jgi:catechol-2,3-dioxygenase